MATKYCALCGLTMVPRYQFLVVSWNWLPVNSSGPLHPPQKPQAGTISMAAAICGTHRGKALSVPAAAPVISAAALRQPQGCRQRGAPVLPSSGAEAPRVLLLLPCASRRCSPGAFLAILVALCLKHFSHAERQGLGRVLFPFIREAEKVSKRVIFYSNSCCGMK